MRRCLCFSLRTGSLIFGILQIIGSIISALIWLAFLFVFMPYLKEAINNSKTEMTLKSNLSNLLKPSLNSTIFGEQQIWNEAQQALERLEQVSEYFTPVFLFLCALSLGFASILIHGIRKKSFFLIRSWMIYQAIALVISMPSVLAYYLFVGVTAEDSLHLFCVFLLGPAINIFAMFVVHSFSKQMLEPTMEKLF